MIRDLLAGIILGACVLFAAPVCVGYARFWSWLADRDEPRESARRPW